jgi:acyl-CoA hydrolase
MRVLSIEAAAAELRSSLPEAPRIVVGGNFATPTVLLEAVTAEFEKLRLFVLNAQGDWPTREGLVMETPFIGPGHRSAPELAYLPMRLSLVPQAFRTTRPPHAVLLQCSPPRAGMVSLGIEVNILPAAIEEVRRRGGLVVAQVNREMPYTLGDGEIDVDLVDLLVEADQPLISPAPHPPDDLASAIGERVAALAEDGCTVQIGIGQIPDAAVTQMGDRHLIGIWTEMMSDGVLGLERAGVLDRSRAVIASFLFGSPELYHWCHDNPRLVMRRTEVVNDPLRIAAQPGMLSINTALQVDIFAQANASYVKGRIYSGFGGQPDFVSGALHSAGGHAVIALRSWHEKSGSTNVVPLLGAPISSFQHSAVVTEHGQAMLFGRSQGAQAHLLIDEVADPRAREGLREAAVGLGLHPSASD